ncbi:DNA repair protein RecO [Saccharicrinis aurantiacus]|uniref:DNA repair protein RecO n=1 Tax=Saccharicrinis aurantiacus TaxID=1849719 RepID=UPI00094F8626|nr:DNA repair protein RecO [Saccharicrinis aurantiacus]
MLQTTRGIVLNYTRYGETSVISHIFTEEFGRQSYMINGVKSRKNKGKNIFLQPLALVDLEVYNKNKSQIQRVKDFKVNTPFFQIPFEPLRRSIAFFMAEVLSKSLTEEHKPHNNLFNFLHQSIEILDSDIQGLENYHLFFLLQLTKPLGFFPNIDNHINSRYFDLNNGHFTDIEPSHKHFMNAWETEILKEISHLGLTQLGLLKLNRESRTQFLEKLLQYYNYHLHGFTKIKSLDILKELFE